MKKVYVSILERPPPNVFKFKVAAAMKGSNFKEYIAREIVDLADVDFFFICYDKEQKPTFLDEAKAFSTIPDQKLKLRLVVRNQSIRLRTAIQEEKTAMFDLKQTCKENILSLGLDEPELYVLTFKPKGGNHPRIFAKQTQLVFQGWKGEVLTLHRRIPRRDYMNKTNENLKKLYNICRLYEADNAVYFRRDMWGEAFGYLYLSEAKNGSDFKKKTLEKMVPEGLQVTDKMLKSAQDTIRQSMFLSAQEAAKNYVDYFIQHGTLCCHAEEVKFLLVDKKWHMQSSRCIYISSQRLLVTKDFYGEIVHSEAITKVTSVTYDKEKVTIDFDHTKQWVLRTENAELLKFIIDDAISVAQQINPRDYRLSSQWEPSDFTEASLVVDEGKNPSPIAVPVADQQEALPDAQLNQDESDSSSSNNNNLVYAGSIRLSRWRDKGIVPGISQIVPPEKGQQDQPYSIANQYFRDLKVLKNLVLPETKMEEEEKEIPDISKLAMFNNMDTRKKLILLSSFLVVVFILFIKNM